MLTKLKQLWTDVKEFFHYSHTIFVARMTALVGFFTAVIGSLNWAPLLGLNLDTGFSKNQVIWLGIITFLQGVGVELARRAKGKEPTL